MAKEYSVRIPITGVIYGTVEADSEKEAIEKAMNDMDLRLVSESKSGDSLEEWEAHEHIVKGNVFYGLCREPDAQCNE